MASFSPYTRPVQPAEWVDPMNLDLLRQGNMYKEDIARQNLADLSNSYQTLANIPAYGKDAEKLQSKLEELRNRVSSLNLSDVSDYNTLGQIKGVINQFSSDPEIMDIAQKWIPYEKERKIQEEMRLKDKEYFSPIIDQGNSYIQNGEYIKGKRFTGNGFINKNLTKEYQDVLSKLQKQKKQVVKNGVVTEEVSYDPDELDRITDEFYNNPAIRQQLEYQINKDANIDWEKQGQEILTRHADAYRNNAYLNEQKLQTINDPAEYQKTLQQIENDKYQASRLEQMAASQDNAEYAKNNYMNQMLDKLKTEAKEKAQFFSEEGRKYDELYMENVKNANDLYKEQFKSVLPGAQQYNLSTAETQAIIKNGSINKGGQIITLDNLADATVTQQATAAYEKSLKQAEAKAKVKSNTLGSLGDTKIPSTQSITIGNTNYTKAQWDDIIERAKNPKTAKWTDSDRSALVDVIKVYPEYFGLPDDYSSLAGTDIKINKNGTIEIVNPWYTRNTPAADLSRFATAVNDAALKKGSSDSNPIDIAAGNNPLDNAAK